MFGPPAAAATLREIFAPFKDLGIYGASPASGRTLGGTDSTSFNQAGLPGIGFQQDPIDYNTHTHHTNLDTYERVIEDDVKKAAVIVASAIYHLSMRDEMLPRFAAAEMPALPAARAGSIIEKRRRGGSAALRQGARAARPRRGRDRRRPSRRPAGGRRTCR